MKIELKINRQYHINERNRKHISYVLLDFDDKYADLKMHATGQLRRVKISKLLSTIRHIKKTN